MPDFPQLPPGHDPGAQSLRNKMGFPILWWFVAIVGIGMFLGGVFIVAGGRGPGYNFWEERLGGTFFGGMGLLCAWVAYSQYRKVKPSPLRRVRGINLAVDRDEARRGETISVTIDHAEATQDLEVGLVCVEIFDLRATTNTKAGMVYIRETNRKNAFEQWQAVEPPAGEQVLTFEIPRELPCSYEGDCLSYAWRVSARLVRKMRTDPRIDHPIWVSP
jgi:hypothetical protein